MFLTEKRRFKATARSDWSLLGLSEIGFIVVSLLKLLLSACYCCFILPNDSKITHGLCLLGIENVFIGAIRSRSHD